MTHVSCVGPQAVPVVGPQGWGPWASSRRSWIASSWRRASCSVQEARTGSVPLGVGHGPLASFASLFFLLCFLLYLVFVACINGGKVKNRTNTWQAQCSELTVGDFDSMAIRPTCSSLALGVPFLRYTYNHTIAYLGKAFESRNPITEPREMPSTTRPRDKATTS